MDNHILVIYGKHKRKCLKLQRMSRSVRIPRRGPSTSSFLLISRESFCALCAHAASGSDESLRNHLCYKTEGVKLMKCLLNIQRSSAATGGGVGVWAGGRTMTPLCGSGLKMRHGQWHLRPSRRGFTLSECTSVVALHKRTTHHVKQGLAQWRSIMQGCIDLSHLDSWQVTGSRFAGADCGLCLTFWDFH